MRQFFESIHSKSLKSVVCFALVISAIMLIFLKTDISSNAEVYSGECGDSQTWKLDTATGVLEITGSGKMNDFSVDSGSLTFDTPWCVYNYLIKTVYIEDGITNIGDHAFGYCFNLKNITIPDSVTNIGDCAFYGCRELTSITIPENITSIGNYAFENCYKLVEVVNNSSIEITKEVFSKSYIAYYALEVHSGESKLDNADGYLFYTYDGINYLLGYSGTDTELVLPENYNGQNYEIYKYAFSKCYSLVSITIPESVTDIGFFAFQDCYKLVEVINKSSLKIFEESALYGEVGFYALEVHSGESKIDNVDGYLFYSSEESIYLLGYSGTDTELVLPADYNEQDYSIYKYAFYNCNSLKSIGLGGSVRTIDDHAFGYCTGLTDITNTDGVMYIGNYAFEYCTGLTSINISDKVTYIGDYVFDYCDKLEKISVSSGNKTYSGKGNCIIKTSSGLLVLGCKNSIIPGDGSVTKIGPRAFSNCVELTDITIPDSITEIDEMAFSGCKKLKNITIPDSVTNIGDQAFSGCEKLANITIPGSVTNIGDQAFSGCTGLAKITIPESVERMGVSAFEGWNGSQIIYCRAGSKPLSWTTKWNGSDNAKIVWGHVCSYAQGVCSECDLPGSDDLSTAEPTPSLTIVTETLPATDEQDDQKTTDSLVWIACAAVIVSCAIITAVVIIRKRSQVKK